MLEMIQTFFIFKNLCINPIPPGGVGFHHAAGKVFIAPEKILDHPDFF